MGVPAVPVLSTPSRLRLILSAVRYLAGKAFTILLTIFAGVFITMLIVNYPTGAGTEPNKSPFEVRLEEQIALTVRNTLYSGTIIIPNATTYEQQFELLIDQLRAQAGLDLPYWPRNLLWTFKALTFNWGELDTSLIQPLGFGAVINDDAYGNPLLDYFPNTLLLVGTSYLLVFLLGMPLALSLARNYGSRLDLVVTVLSPISSVPSWVFAILFIALFAVQLRWLPVGGMVDALPSKTPFEYVLVVSRHMILPVCALVLSLLFQLVYAWRTFFILYSEEDYVELARAKGLNHKLLERRYVLRPALPYIITSFTTSLIGFWQLTVALESVFQWPGIGLLYIEALPNYWGESVAIGDLMIVIQIVVIFAYVLGILVFILDVVYVILDSRIHLIPNNDIRKNTRLTSIPVSLARLFSKDRMKRKSPNRAWPVKAPREKWTFSSSEALRAARESLSGIRGRSALFFQELSRYPSAIFGLTIILILLAGSLYALVALPYEEFGRSYNEDRVSGFNVRPRVAVPTWFDFFRGTPRLSTLILDENSAGVSVSTSTLDSGWTQKTVTFTFQYPYDVPPSDVFLYLDPTYEEKFPFASLVWKTPDGRTLDLKPIAVGNQVNYDFEEGIPTLKLLDSNPAWKEWFVVSGQYPTPSYQLLFAQPGTSQPTPQTGEYQLELSTLFFEEHSDLHPQLVLLGQVYGLAGTDFWRRDLVVPLFWGMPFALFVGFLGTFITTLVALLLPAIGVWYGGWLDNLIQRLTEVNMILPGLAIAVLTNLLFGVNIWIVLGIVVLLNAFGSPIKSFRSAFLQAKEAPYIEMARSYGASDFRIITRYLVPRILPVFIPQLVTQVPSFIFLEATLGFFKINSEYPSWGRIIYDGLANGAIYGSPFWVLEPIFLLLLTGLAFAMLGSALERILNPRIISDVPVVPKKIIRRRRIKLPVLSRRLFAGMIAALFLAALFVPTVEGKTLAVYFLNIMDETRRLTVTMTKPTVHPTHTSLPTASTPTELPASATEPSPTLTVASTALPTSTATQTPTLTPPSTASQPTTYILQRGEYPYCIARRFNVDPGELLVLNGMLNNETFFAGAVLQIPQTGKPFPGERMQKIHPATYIVSRAGETMYTIACEFGDVHPETIAQANGLSVDSILATGQQLHIP